jgi:hypothetical protein
MADNPVQSTKTGAINPADSLGGLLGIFFIACVEFQRLWPTGTSLIYLVISTPLLLIWIAHQAGWKFAERHAGLAVDISIYVLVVASLGIRFGSSQPNSVLASTLLFWAPLASAWWAWRYQNLPLRLWLMLGGLFVVLTWQLADSHERLLEHLILSLLVALLVRYAYRPQNSGSTINLRDALTGLSSPESFEAELAHLSAISDRYQFPFSLIGCRVTLLEVDTRQAEQLCLYAEAIVERLRTADTPCRWDGNTFMIVLPNTSEAMATTVANGIRVALEHFDFGRNIPLPMSIVTVQHEPGEDPMNTVSTLESKLANATK